MQNFFKYFAILSILFGAIWSAVLYYQTYDVKNIPELTSSEQLSSQFVRVKIQSVKILPEVFETKIGKKATFLTYITTDKGISFISPIAEEKVKENKIQAGETLVFGKEGEDSKIEKKSAEINRIASKYDLIKSNSIMYLQGSGASFYHILKPFGYSVGAVLVVFGLLSKFKVFK